MSADVELRLVDGSDANDENEKTTNEKKEEEEVEDEQKALLSGGNIFWVAFAGVQVILGLKDVLTQLIASIDDVPVPESVTALRALSTLCGTYFVALLYVLIFIALMVLARIRFEVLQKQQAKIFFTLGVLLFLDVLLALISIPAANEMAIILSTKRNASDLDIETRHGNSLDEERERRKSFPYATVVRNHILKVSVLLVGLLLAVVHDLVKNKWVRNTACDICCCCMQGFLPGPNPSLSARAFALRLWNGILLVFYAFGFWGLLVRPDPTMYSHNLGVRALPLLAYLQVIGPCCRRKRGLALSIVAFVLFWAAAVHAIYFIFSESSLSLFGTVKYILTQSLLVELLVQAGKMARFTMQIYRLHYKLRKEIYNGENTTACGCCCMSIPIIFLLLLPFVPLEILHAKISDL